MLGFEIKVNEDDVMHVASEGPSISVVMLVTQKEDKDFNYMTVGGMDSRINLLSWPGKDLELGDRIRIRVAEINEIKPVPDKYPYDRQTVKEHYFQMKKELEEYISGDERIDNKI